MTPLRIFVRRGALRRFHRLKQESEGLAVAVEWDRRMGERRAEPLAQPELTDRRRAERRREPPFTWRAAEFVVINEPESPNQPDPKDTSKDSGD
jgi:hypothetical protein